LDILLCCHRVCNPPQRTVVLFQYQLADTVIAADEEVFDGNGFAVGQLNDQVIPAAVVLENVSPFSVDFYNGGIIQRHLRPVCY